MVYTYRKYKEHVEEGLCKSDMNVICKFCAQKAKQQEEIR